MNANELYERLIKDLERLLSDLTKQQPIPNLRHIPQLGLLSELLRESTNLGYFDGRDEIDFYLSECRTSKDAIVLAFHSILEKESLSGNQFMQDARPSLLPILEHIHKLDITEDVENW